METEKPKVSSVKAIKGGTLIDGTGNEPIRNSLIIIEDSKIVEVGQVGQIKIPSGAEVIDASGRVVMPGLIDCHTHISFPVTPFAATGFGALEYSQADRTIWAVVAVKKLIEAGVTTIRDMGSTGHIDLAVRDAIKRGDIVGPRIFGSDAGLTITGGHMDVLKNVRSLAFDLPLEYTQNQRPTADGVEECIKVVREQIRVGADQIKMWATGGVMETTERALIREYSDEEIKAIVKEAKKSGRFVASHAVGPPDAIKVCVEEGVRSIEHGIFNDEESIRMMSEKGTYLVPTMVAYHLLTAPYMPQVIKEVANRAVIAHEKTLKMAKKAGIKIALGTDSGSPFGSVHGEVQHKELELMATRGLTAMESIVAATKTAAECIGIGNKTGTIEPGKFADLIVIDGNPLDNIKVLQEKGCIKMVMKEGKVYVKNP
ncbi:MAG: amidohydrolase family protein [Candidatus Jordarchaeaceae archaeon]